MTGLELLGYAMIELALWVLWYRWGMTFMGCYIPLRSKYGWTWKFTVIHTFYNLRQLFTTVVMLGYTWWLVAMLVQWVKPVSVL